MWNIGTFTNPCCWIIILDVLRWWIRFLLVKFGAVAAFDNFGGLSLSCGFYPPVHIQKTREINGFPLCMIYKPWTFQTSVGLLEGIYPLLGNSLIHIKNWAWLTGNEQFLACVNYQPVFMVSRTLEPSGFQLILINWWINNDTSNVWVFCWWYCLYIHIYVYTYVMQCNAM